MAAGYSDGTLRVFSISRIAVEFKMHPHRAALTAVAYSADGEEWGPAERQCRHTSGLGARASQGNTVALSGPGQTILSGDKDGLVAVSRPRTGMTFRVLSDHQGALIATIQSTNKEVTWLHEPAGPGRGDAGRGGRLGWVG